MDFGDSRGYSPLDLVMAARSCSLSEAFEWLEQRVWRPRSIETRLPRPMTRRQSRQMTTARMATEDRNETYPVLQKVDFAVMHNPALLPLTLSANRGPFLVHARHQTGRPRHVISIFRKDLKQYSLLVFHALKLKCAYQSQQQQRPC